MKSWTFLPKNFANVNTDLSTNIRIELQRIQSPQSGDASVAVEGSQVKSQSVEVEIVQGAFKRA